MTLTVEKVLMERDADAALYLLSRMLGVPMEVGLKKKLLNIQGHIRSKKSVTKTERDSIVTFYREVIG